MNKYLVSLLVGFCTLTIGLEAKISGKMDFGPAYATLKVYENGVKVRKKDMPGAKLNGTFVLKESGEWYNGLTFKPDLVFLKGGDEYASVGFGTGYFIPLSMISDNLSKFSICPHVGVGIGRLKAENTSYSNPYTPDGLGPTSVSAGIASGERTDYFTSAYMGMDLGVSITEKLFLSLFASYKLTETRSKVFAQKTVNDSTAYVYTVSDTRDHAASHGWSWAAQADYYFNDNWSLGLAYGYEGSKMKEKYSSKLNGYRISAGYTF
jgi:hypothetical protein